jgi:hypothetical protein
MPKVTSLGLGSLLLLASTTLTPVTAATLAAGVANAPGAGMAEPAPGALLRLAQNVRNSTGTGGVMNNIQGGPPGAGLPK